MHIFIEIMALLVYHIHNKAMKPSLQLTLTALFAACGIALPAKAGIVLDWNTQALNAVQSSGNDAPMAARNLAMLQAAIYDAVNGLDGGHTAFHVTGTGPSGASIDAAAAAAANTILGALYPALGSSFTTLYNDQLSALANDQAKTDGINWGNQVATQILNWRQSDGSATAAGATVLNPTGTPYTPSGQIGGWGPTPHSVPTLNYVNPPTLPGWGNVTPFAMASGSQYRPTAFGGQSALTYLTTAQYAADYNQVATLGAKVGSLRTADQTESAFFWNDRTGSITAVGQWNQIAKNLLGTSTGTVTEAVVMAALNIALADASISAWDAKYSADFWRPITAIAYGDQDGNAATIGDSLAGIPGIGWEPLLDTPSTPEFVAENSSFSGSAVIVLKNYFGDVAFSMQGDTDGDGIVDGTRSWTSLTAAGLDAGMSSIYGGYGFLDSVQKGQALGQAQATALLETNFLAVPEPRQPNAARGLARADRSPKPQASGVSPNTLPNVLLQTAHIAERVFLHAHGVIIGERREIHGKGEQARLVRGV